MTSLTKERNLKRQQRLIDDKMFSPPKKSLMGRFRTQELVVRSTRAGKAGRNRKFSKPKEQSSFKNFSESNIEDESIGPSYGGPWAPSHVPEQIQNDDTSSNWCGIKLSALRRILNFTKETEFLDADQHAIQTKLEMLENYWKEFNNVCINGLSITNAAGSYLEQGEDIYFTAKASLRSRLAIVVPQVVEQEKLSDNVLRIQWSDMPNQFKLPTFSGDYAKWAPFRDAFIEEVHNNINLSNAQRLRKLLAALEGPAKRAVGEWSIASDENYLLAWSSLRQQFDNNHQTIRAHMQEVNALLPVRQRSFEDLREILDIVRVNRRHLLSLLSSEQLVDFQFMHQIEQLLDPEGRHEWEMRHRTNELPTLEEMFAFLEQRANCLASLEKGASNSRVIAASPPEYTRNNSKSAISTTQRISGQSQSKLLYGQGRPPLAQFIERKRPTDTRKCFKCDFPGHALFHCDEFKSMPINERREFVQKKRLCESCFSPNHLANNCSRESCPRCPGQRHNSILCQLNKRTKSDLSSIQTDPGISLALLATAQVRLKIGPFTTRPIRALCDSGSQVNLIARSVVQTEHLPTTQCSIRIAGVNSVSKNPITRKICCQLLSRFSENPVAELELLVVPVLSLNSLPKSPLDTNIIPKDIQGELADPVFHIPANVDMLLGAGVWATVLNKISSINKLGITAQSSRLGWLLYGGGVCPLEEAQVSLVHARDDHLSTILHRFWEVEEIPPGRVQTKEQEECETFFMDHHYRNSTGRYVVGIPFRSDIDEIGSSRDIALRRLYALERRFDREPALREKYIASINEMLEAGHLRQVDREPKGWCYYIPHHAVTRKFRVVFDASCKTNYGISLNEAQMIGEKLQEDLFDLILRFRTHRIGITTDVKKMYLQVEVIEKQWDVQRIVWRPDPKADVKEYWLTRVTFGMASAPHCAVRAMIQCARDQQDEFPQGARVIERDFYMDDGITGADNEEEARALCIEMSTILHNGGFPLSKWHSNGVNVVPKQSLQSTEAVDLGEFNDTTVLGLRWLPVTDELTFKFKPQPPGEKQAMTMRNIFSQIAQLFDPNGYLGPAIVRAKIIMQCIWKAKIGWDAQVPDKIGNDWIQFQSQLPELIRIRIPRWLGIAPTHSFTLHGFADASEVAYGAVIYVRVEHSNGTICTLLTSRSRVAPVKTLTIPRLELCAVVLLSELMQVVRKACKFEFIRTVLWTDSSIVLHWMEKEPETLKPFVHNRIQTIRKLTNNCEWRHITTADNPADALSRGIAPADLESLKIWWNGPSWLVKNGSEWPVPRAEFSVHIEKEIHAEMKSNWLEMANDKKLRPIQKAFTSVAVFEMRGENASKHTKADMLSRTSSWRRLIRRTAWVWRYIDNLKLRGDDKPKRETGDVTEAEEERAIDYWVKREQSVYFSPELNALRNGEPVPKKSQLLRLSPIIDEKDIMRVGGRLENAELSYEQKHPIILPDISHLAKLLIREAHERTLHGGFQLMAAALRQRFWITNLRRAIRTQISRCIPCVRQSQKLCEQLMGNLPADRVRQSPPFSHTGVDYAGPFEVKARGARCKIMEKKYVAIFVCMSTKAIHIELVEDLSTSAFMAAFLRFTSIRGSCTNLWSDNGTCFVGAEKELARMVNSWSQMDSDAYKEMRELRVKWHFITPSAPHQGGLWESKVKAMKFHLRRVVGQHKLTSTEFQTLLAQISAILNSKPLTALTDDPDDLNFLSPGHLIHGRPLKQLFGERMDESPRSALRRYALTQHMSQSFWKQWHQAYLNELQQRPKWKTKRENLKIGDLVLIKDENAAPTFWPTGRITQIFPGSDSLVRNVELRVAGKKRRMMRPVQKLVLLPLDQIEESADSSRGECAQTASK